MKKINHIAKKNFILMIKKYYKVRYHCHFTGTYKGAANNVCNSNSYSIS